MKSKRARMPSPAMIVAVIALIAATAATTYAVTVPRKSVGTAQIKKAAVTTGKLKNGSVISSKLKDGAVVDEKLNDGAVTSKKLANGSVGARALGKIVTRVAVANVADGTGGVAVASCGSGERLISGGARFDEGTVGNTQLVSSHPTKAGSADPADGDVPLGWRGAGFNPGGGGMRALRVFAICIG